MLSNEAIRVKADLLHCPKIRECSEKGKSRGTALPENK